MRLIPSFALLLAATSPLWAAGSQQSVLFIGNSYTLGSHVPGVESHGGMPAMIQSIAKSKGRTLIPGMVVAPGQNWGHHLTQAETDSALAEKPWDQVVIQDHSTQATHIGNEQAFFRDGSAFGQRIQQGVPGARIVLYQTWARSPKTPFYTGVSGPRSFVDPAEMSQEIISNYARLAAMLEENVPQSPVAVAPVGLAFQLSQERHPEIDLYIADLHHASAEGLYLTALVMYATLFGDSPEGATNEMPGLTIPPDIAALLRQVAVDATTPSTSR